MKQVFGGRIYHPFFNSNPDFIDAPERFTSKTVYELSDVKMYLWQETSRDNSALPRDPPARGWPADRHRRRDRPASAGTLSPDRPAADRRRVSAAGVGREAARAIEDILAAEGWRQVRLGVSQSHPAARHFWEVVGYACYGERRDVIGRAG